MKKLLTAFFFLFSTPALAGVPCTLPFNLQNGQPADATQVMANYNALVSCLNLAAAAGNNSDITSLSALTTPIPPALGGTSAYIASAPSTGTANAQVVSATTPTYVQTQLTKVVFRAGFTNTGAMTLTVGTTPVLPVFRRTTDGLQPLAGGEIVAGTVTEVVYDGTQYQLVNNVSPFPVGTVLDTIAAAADTGFLLMLGQCVPSSTFPALFAKMGNFQGTCTSGQMQVPDARGRVVAALDSGTTNLSVVCALSTTLYSTCGVQQYTLQQSDLPNVNPALGVTTNSIAVTDPGHAHGYTPSPVTNIGLTTLNSTGYGTPTATNATATTTAYQVNNPPGCNPPGTGGTPCVVGTGITAALSLVAATRINGNVTQTLIPQVQPTLMLNKQIKY